MFIDLSNVGLIYFFLTFYFQSTLLVHDLEKERSKSEMNQQRLEKLLEDLQERLEANKEEKRKLKSEAGEKSARLSTLECLVINDNGQQDYYCNEICLKID